MPQPAQRQAAFKAGAAFERDADGVEVFTFTMDASSIVGPRPATEADKATHAAAYAEFVARDSAIAAAAAEQADLASARERLAKLEADIDRLKAQHVAELEAAAAGMTQLREQLDTMTGLHEAAQEEISRLDQAEQAARAELAELKAAKKPAKAGQGA